jgi:uncharacterized protein (DUF1697 family)
MTTWVGFLRGVNLGKRQMKMAELKACLEAAGYHAVKTIVASGNVRFEADGSEAAVKAGVERAMAEKFAFLVKTLLRSSDELDAMLSGHPFATLDPDADVARHVLLFDAPLPPGLSIENRPGHTEVLRIDAREIYIAGYRQPNGRYTEGVEETLKPLYTKLGKGVLDTMRNWNTIDKVLK